MQALADRRGVYVPVQADLNSVASARPIFAAITDALLAIAAIMALLGIGSAVIVHVGCARRRAAGNATPRRVEVYFAAAVLGARRRRNFR